MTYIAVHIYLKKHHPYGGSNLLFLDCKYAFVGRKYLRCISIINNKVNIDLKYVLKYSFLLVNLGD